ncbi:MAG TPA: hypothetical protein VF450_12455 [Noviherbaspirillum sp.]
MTSAKLLTFSLDSNCIYAVEESRPDAVFVKELLHAHAAGKASVALVAISGSERQRGGGHLESFDEFKARVNALGFGGLELLMPKAYLGITYWNNAEWSDPGDTLERSIHEIVFPGIPFQWEDYCREKGLDPVADFNSDAARKWKNAKCDVLALWSHAIRGRDVFVTRDTDFLAETKKRKLIALVGGHIETPESAVALLRKMTA